jgi:uncharacterized protein with HEPN domain
VRDDAGRLQDILDSIRRIQERIGGEAARSISQALRAAYPGIPWTSVIAMRNLLVHEYFGVDIEEVWSTAVNDLPLLRPEVEAMLAELS